MSDKNNPHSLLWFALAATFLVYAGALSYPFVYDDVPQIVMNPRITSWSYFPSYFSTHVWAHVPVGINPNYYRPVFMIWMLVTHTLGGMESWVWHFSTLSMHLLATFLFYRLALRLGRDHTEAGIAAIFFGLHPIHVESVAWVSGVTDPLLAIFMMLAFLSYLGYMDMEQTGLPALRLILMNVWFLFALWSKEVAIVLPAIVLLH